MRIIFEPSRPPGAPLSTPNTLTFVAVTHDDGTPIPDDRLKWMTDGDHEALCVECLIGMNPPPSPLPPGQAVERLAELLPAAIGLIGTEDLWALAAALVARGVSVKPT